VIGLFFMIYAAGSLRQDTRHALLLFWPGVRCLGQKEKSVLGFESLIQVGSSLSADGVQPELRL